MEKSLYPQLPLFESVFDVPWSSLLWGALSVCEQGGQATAEEAGESSCLQNTEQSSLGQHRVLSELASDVSSYRTDPFFFDIILKEKHRAY